MKLYCTKCKYRFEKDRIPGRCPYCSSDNSVKQKEKAQDILKDVIDEMDAIEESMKERGA